ncbi:MAG: hypothetical protein WBA74_08170, partial [Cyclobacteriaceae bacterium]
FKAGEYQDAITSLQLVRETDARYPVALAYLGAAYDLSGENEKAISTFDILSDLENSIDRSKGYWYKLLIYMKSEDLPNSLKTLEIILQDPANYNYDKAVALYKELTE